MKCLHVSHVAGPNYPVVNPVPARGAQQRQPSQHSRRGTLVQSGQSAAAPAAAAGPHRHIFRWHTRSFC